MRCGSKGARLLQIGLRYAVILTRHVSVADSLHLILKSNSIRSGRKQSQLENGQLNQLINGGMFVTD